MNRYEMVSLANVDINNGFWQYRQTLNREVTVPGVRNSFENMGHFASFKLNWREGQEKKPHFFWDSDIAKWMEGVAYLLQKGQGQEYQAKLEEVVDDIEKGQDELGYFNIYFQSIEPSKRFSNRDWHELYCAGHLIEAAVAYDQATGRDRFLKIMMKYADYIDQVFRVEQSAAFATPGHEELELALIKLYRHTGVKKYLDLAKFFIDERGRHDKDGHGRVTQTHIPVREMETAEGHSVRLGYLMAAVADVARETEDEELLAVCKKVFDNIFFKRMYITGGVGSTWRHEAYTVDYDLPNDVAYTETCAAISLAYFARRMLTMEAESVYADVIETVLYNGFLSSTSLDGKRFFYDNPLSISMRDRGRNVCAKENEWLPITQRVEKFSCSCCPPNIVRFVASVGEYMYTKTDSRLYIHQFAGSEARIEVGGRAVRVLQETDYPLSGLVRVTLENADGLEVAVRIPGWCRKLSLNAERRMEKGYAIVKCAGDSFTFTLDMDMTPELLEANPEVQADAGRVALKRGPVVYCLEEAYNGETPHDLMVDAQLTPSLEYNEEMHMPIIRTRGWKRPEAKYNWLYRPLSLELEEKELTFIPYFAFANRGDSDMEVWVLLKR